MSYFNRAALVFIATSLTACSGTTLSNPFKKAEAVDPPAISEPIVLVEEEPEIELGTGGQSPDALDKTSADEIAKAAVVSGGNALGETVASLGDPTQAGLWLRTPLVKAETPGRLEAANGKSLAVTLIPIAGEASAGSRISLAAMRGLGLGLTDLPSLQVFRVTAAG